MSAPSPFSPPIRPAATAENPLPSPPTARAAQVDASGPKATKRRGGWITAAVLVVVTIVLAGLYMTAKSELDDTKSELVDVTSQRDTLVAAADAAQVEAESLPDVLDVVDSFVGGADGYYVAGDETYVSISVTSSGLFATDGLIDALVELGFPEGIGARIGNTRALDGTLSADGDKVSATWSYHPDDGLSLVIERND